MTMAMETEPGPLKKIGRQISMRADILSAHAAESLRQGSASIRDALGPEKAEPQTYPERPFGREEGGADVARVVWMGHTIETPEGERYFGAAGLTENGYYRAAEVRAYGSDEHWCWNEERHT